MVPLVVVMLEDVDESELCKGMMIKILPILPC